MRTPILLATLVAFGSAAVTDDLKTMSDRKAELLVETSLASVTSIPKWTSGMADDGSWSDVDYTAGCDGRRANWPAQQHFNRLQTMASQFYASPDNSSDLLPYISKGLDYWFENDYTEPACVDQGGLTNSTCPCGTPGLWNSNWYDQMILMPGLISSTCLLLKSNLTETQLSNCTVNGQRPMDRIDDWIYGIGPMTGANMLAVATAVLNTGLLTENATTAQFAVDHFYNQTLIVPATGADGVKVDGSYLQHIAQLYTGNYGKDFTKSVIALYQQTRDTAFSAPEASQTAFQTLMDGTQWMIVSNSTRGDVSSSLLWEYSAIGRMVSFVYKDGQASGGVAINFTQLADSTSDWKNSSFFKDLSTSMLNPSDKDANQGDLIGTRAFYSSDYLVHRGDGYVTTLKMFSKRTTNSECNNDQNPFGFHLSDGVIYSYIQGGEYIDVFGEWDWNLAPGSTVDYGNTAFGCNITQWYGNTTFVGSVTANGDTTAKSGNGGLAVMQYLNPMTGDLQWEKTYFFFPGLYAVQIGPISSKSSSPVITTLDQSNLKGDVYINGVKTTQDVTTTNTVKASQIWHNNILYTIPEGNNLTLTVNTTAHPDNDWAKLGISTGTATQRLFQATLTHPELDVKNTKKNDIKLNSYIAQLNTDAKSTSSNDTDSLIQLATQEHPAKVRGAYYVKDKTIALAFWSKGNYKTAWGWTFKTDQPVLLMLSQSKGLVLNVADPTQNLSQVKITVTSTTGKNASYKLTVKLPTDETAGSTVTVKLS